MGRKAQAYLAASVLVRILVKVTLVVLVIVSYVNAPMSTTLADASTQRTRLQLLVKDVLVLRYVPPGATQAYSELQAALPGWQTEEAALQSIPDSGVQIAVAATISDYSQITAALRAILAHPDKPVDPVQVEIIRMHEAGYRTAITQVIMLIQQQVVSQRFVAFVLVIGITSFLIALCLIDVAVVRRSLATPRENTQ